MSHLLAIETSHRQGSVALGPIDGGECRVILFPPGLVHARELHPAIDRGVKEAGLDRTSIARIAVSHGPGSYTGIRVGVAAAKSLAWALGCGTTPVGVGGISSLAAIAQTVIGSNAIDDGQEFAVVVDARRGTCYAARFRRDARRVVRIDADHLAEVSSYFASLDPNTVLVGSGSRTLPGAEAFTLLDESLDSPDASSIFHLAIELGSANDLSDPHALMPVYFRPSEAEERRQQSP